MNLGDLYLGIEVGHLDVIHLVLNAAAPLPGICTPYTSDVEVEYTALTVIITRTPHNVSTTHNVHI